MADIVNLNQIRKAKAREEQQRQAQENRLRFGRSKTEKETVHRLETKADRALEGHRRERPDRPDDDQSA
jgi:hypothetical protein